MAYQVRVLEEVDYNEYVSYCYAECDTIEQAYEMVYIAECETHCNAYVEESL